MTTPTIFSDVAANAGELQPTRTDGIPYTFKSVTTIPLATAGSVAIGLVRLLTGTRVVNMAFTCDDIDSATSITFDMGWLYDTPTAAAVEDDNGFFDELDIGQDGGSRVWPLADMLPAADEGFVAAAPGYLAILVRDSGSGGTTSAGDFNLNITIQEGQTVV